MHYQRILLKYNNNDNCFAIDWQCFPNRIVTEGVSNYVRCGRQYANGFDKIISSPIELYKRLDAFHMERCPDNLDADHDAKIYVEITIDAEEYAKCISGSYLNISAEQLVMEMIANTPDDFQAIAWRVFGLDDGEIPQFPLQ